MLEEHGNVAACSVMMVGSERRTSDERLEQQNAVIDGDLRAITLQCAWIEWMSSSSGMK